MIITIRVINTFIISQCGRPGFDPWVGKILWRRKWQPTSVYLPGKSHGWRSLAVYNPWGCKESDTTSLLHYLRPHGLQHTRLPCPSPSPRACSHSCPLSRRCHPTISSSVVPFSSCLLMVGFPFCVQVLLYFLRRHEVP